MRRRPTAKAAAAAHGYDGLRKHIIYHYTPGTRIYTRSLQHHDDVLVRSGESARTWGAERTIIFLSSMNGWGTSGRAIPERQAFSGVRIDTMYPVMKNNIQKLYLSANATAAVVHLDHSMQTLSKKKSRPFQTNVNTHVRTLCKNARIVASPQKTSLGHLEIRRHHSLLVSS